MIQNFKMILQYDGTRYNGWQRQGNTHNTIQGKLEDIFSKYFDQPIELQASGRTDAGVHAIGQTVSFKVDYSKDKRRCDGKCDAKAIGKSDGKYDSKCDGEHDGTGDGKCAECDTGYIGKLLPVDKLMDELNSYLPEDIRITALSKADLRFHARLNAVQKEYRYYISLERKRNVFSRKYMMSLEEPEKLDIESMRMASRLMLGEHDFQGFSDNRSKKSTVRCIASINLEIMHSDDFRGDYLEISFCGNGFLYHTIRLLVGTLVAIGMGTAGEDIIHDIFDSKDRRKVPFMAPAEGLFLYKVNYKD